MAESSPAPESGPDDSVKRRLEHVAEVSKQARASWFLMLGFLAFAGVTLLGVEDADFFRYGASTDLPVLNIEIPTRSFFWVAPLLIAGFFVHLHLYLLKLWNAIALLPDTVDGHHTDACVFPWLITDWGLARRKLRRGRPLCLLNDLIVLALVWILPVVILGLFWWRVIPIRDKPLIAWSGLLACLVAAIAAHALVASIASLWFAGRRPIDWDATTRIHRLVGKWWSCGLFLFCAATILSISIDRVEYGLVFDLARADLRGAELSVKPIDWQPYAIARDEFLAEYRQREGLPPYDQWSHEQQEAFYELWRYRRSTAISNIKAPTLIGRDLRHADLTDAFLPGVKGLRVQAGFA
ncbi:MAG: hypothetical protein ACFCBV_07820 [Phycisphaerales bacterium]